MKKKFVVMVMIVCLLFVNLTPHVLASGGEEENVSQESIINLTENNYSVKLADDKTEYAYTGDEIRPDIKVVYSEKDENDTMVERELLRQNDDGTVNYEVSYSNNTEPGVATILVNGTGNYEGSLSITFQIVKENTEEESSIWVEYDPDRYGDVKSAVVLQSEPGTTYDTLLTIPKGKRILLDGYEKTAEGSWYKTTYNEVTGYVSSSNVKLSYQAYDPNRIGEATANIYMRSGVGLNYSKLMYIEAGMTMTVYGYYRVVGYDWFYVECNGVKGYVSSKYVKEKFTWVEYDPDRYGDVKSAVALQAEPGTSYEKLLTIPSGERILLEGYKKSTSGSWYKTTYNGKSGYVSSEKVKLSYQVYSPNKTGKTTANLYMRSGVGLNYSKKVYIPSGSKITVYGYYRVVGYDWFYVNYDGVKGYISSKYVGNLTSKPYWKYVNGYKLYYDSNGKLVKDVSNIIGKQSSYVIKVNKKQNCVTVYAKDGNNGYIIPVKAFVCSTGTATPTGTFYTPAKYRWRELMGPCWGQWTTVITGNFLFHSVYYNSYNNNMSLSVNAYNKLGTTASHGCVRLTAGDAKWIYDNCKLKTKVIIYNGSSAGPLGKPSACKLPSWHTWDPTDPNVKYKCNQKGCH